MRMRLLIALLTAAAALAAGGCDNAAARKLSIDHYVRGQILADQGQVDAALAELSKAAAADPKLSVAHSAMGDIYRHREQFQLARRSYERACKANPYAFRPHYNLGVIYQVLARAAESIQRAQDYLREAVAVYLRAITIEPDDFDSNLNLSACYFGLGKFALAETYCRAAIARKPTDPAPYNNLGMIFDSQNRPYEAIKVYKDSLEINVHQPRLLMDLGATYLRQGRLKQALRYFELSADEDPNNAAPREQMGLCHYHLGEYDKSLEAYRKAAQINKNSPAAFRGIGVASMTLYQLSVKDGNGDPALRDRALEAWHTSLELLPNQKDIADLVHKYTPKLTRPGL